MNKKTIETLTELYIKQLNHIFKGFEFKYDDKTAYVIQFKGNSYDFKINNNLVYRLEFHSTSFKLIPKNRVVPLIDNNLDKILTFIKDGTHDGIKGGIHAYIHQCYQIYMKHKCRMTTTDIMTIVQKIDVENT